MLLEGKVAIVAGIGPGLGRANALALARAGADVALAARTAARLDEVAKEVEALGRRALPVQADITRAEDCENVVAQTLAKLGRVDVLVNNAFQIPPFERLPDQEIEKIRKSFEINLFAPLRLSQCVIPHMAERGSGSIVMINSVVLRHAKPNYGAYKMAKHALLGMARNLACEVGPQGIRVNSVAPGYVGDATVDLVAKLQGMAEKRPEPEVKRELLDTLMLRRAAEPEEIADAVVFFASDMSRSITGQCLDVNGGEYTH